MSIRKSAVARFAGVLVAVALVGVGSTHASAGTIDNTAGFGSQFNTADTTVGGTFLADDTNLASFTMELKTITAGTSVAAVVYATDGGAQQTPTGSPIWTGTPFTLTTTRTVYAFSPNVALVSGAYYYIGITSQPGVVAGTGPAVTNQYRAFTQGGTLASPAQVWTNTATASTPTAGDFNRDVRSLIVMNPEPGTWALFALGLAGLCVARRRRRRAPANAAH